MISKDSSNPTLRPEETKRIAQQERARGTWALSIDLAAQALSAEHLRLVIKILRVKRAERESFCVGLPGVVRRGARVDLEAPFEKLREGGVPCRLERHY